MPAGNREARGNAHNVAALDVLPVHRCQGIFGIFLVDEANEGKALGFAGVPVWCVQAGGAYRRGCASGARSCHTLTGGCAWVRGRGKAAAGGRERGFAARFFLSKERLRHDSLMGMYTSPISPYLEKMSLRSSLQHTRGAGERPQRVSTRPFFCSQIGALRTTCVEKGRSTSLASVVGKLTPRAGTTASRLTPWCRRSGCPL